MNTIYPTILHHIDVMNLVNETTRILRVDNFWLIRKLKTSIARRMINLKSYGASFILLIMHDYP